MQLENDEAKGQRKEMSNSIVSYLLEKMTHFGMDTDEITKIIRQPNRRTQWTAVSLRCDQHVHTHLWTRPPYLSCTCSRSYGPPSARICLPPACSPNLLYRSLVSCGLLQLHWAARSALAPALNQILKYSDSGHKFVEDQSICWLACHKTLAVCCGHHPFSHTIHPCSIDEPLTTHTRR